MKNRPVEMGLVVGMVFLFIVSAVSPMIIGCNIKIAGQDEEIDEFLENLAFYCSDKYSSSKLE